jgi:hypothetical protein
MAQVLTARTQLHPRDLTGVLEVVLAEALFASTAQSSEFPGPERIRREVGATLRRLSSSGCAAEVAAEFGDHPDTAAARMSWALATIRATYRTAGALHFGQSAPDAVRMTATT